LTNYTAQDALKQIRAQAILSLPGLVWLAELIPTFASPTTITDTAKRIAADLTEFATLIEDLANASLPAGPHEFRDGRDVVAVVALGDSGYT
jgi:hypothetical protein